jgi:DNA primase
VSAAGPQRARIPEAMLEEIRLALPIEQVVSRHVALKRRGQWWTGLCPFHQEKSPSFSVHPARRNFHCFGCGAHGDVVGFVMRYEGLSFPDAVARCAAECGLSTDLEAAKAAAPWARKPRTASSPDMERVRDAEQRSRAAWGLWDRAQPAGQAVRGYLAGRHLPFPAPCGAVLREARLRHPETGDALHPVMICRIDGPDGTFRAVHRTYLAPLPGGGFGKLGGVENAKLTLGPLPGGAIRLFPPARHLAVAEGIETALAVHALTGMPVWACIAAEILAALQLPFDVARLTIFADRDKPKPPRHPEGHGVAAARALADRQRAMAVQSEVRVPMAPFKDYADVLEAKVAA